jgi:hypothetical protein
MSLVHVLLEDRLVQLGHLADFTSGVEQLPLLAKGFAPELVAPATGIDAAARCERERASMTNPFARE